MNISLFEIWFYWNGEMGIEFEISILTINNRSLFYVSRWGWLKIDILFFKVK